MSWADILTALKAGRNYGAKVGGVIAGNLGRGQGGRFAKVGSGASPAPAGKGKRGDVLKAAGVSESEAKALEDFLAGKPVDEDALAGLFDKGLIDFTSDEKPVANAQGRALAGALKKGDVRKATDAVARGGDRAKKRDAKKAPKAAKPKAGGGGKGKAPKPPKEKPQRDPAKDAEKATRIGDQLDVLDAQVRGSQMNEATRVAAQNRLDKAERDLQELSISSGEKQAAQARIDKIRAALDVRIAAGDKPIPANNEPGEGKPSTTRRTTKEAGLTVMKEASGRYRWVIVSSNAFEDKEREIVSEKALAEDADRMDSSGEYGPLRWWHVGDVVFEQPGDWLTAKAGPGIDIGVCDFVALHDKMLIESGTFADETVAQAVAKAAPNLQVSRGFTHPLGEPVDGVFTAIKGVERSLLPAGTAANAFTSVSVQENKNMATLKEKWDAFKALFDGNEDEATKFAAGVSSKSKELQAAGVAFKEDAPAAVAEAATEAKAEGDMPAGEAEAETEGEDMAETVGDMTVDELAAALVASPAFLDALTGVIGKGLEPVAAAVEKAMSAQTEATTKEAGEITALKALAAKLDSRVKTLEGDAPTGAKGFVASQSKETVTEKQIDLNRGVSDAERLTSFFVSGAKQ